MAIFDFKVHCQDRQRGLSRALLRQLQALAKNRNLELRFRWVNKHYYVTVDGSLLEMQALTPTAIPYLYGYSEAYPEPKNLSTRRNLCDELIDSYLAGVERISDDVHEIAEYIGGTANSYRLDPGTRTHLTGPLRSFRISLVMYHNGLLAPASLAEDAHTAAELLLKAVLLRDSRPDSFEGLVKSAITAQLLQGYLEQPLLELKNLRKNAKHRGQGVSAKRLNELLPSILSACQTLASTIRNLPTPSQSAATVTRPSGNG